nr:symmetrical bis(5'-nucleosyl)-tetraphosphatase [Burkholderiales bacterium]
LVNRGPHSLLCMRLVKSLGDRAVVVLGNHDLHLLVIAAKFVKPHDGDTVDDILQAPDRDELLHWLRHRPLLHHAAGHLMVHAGLLPDWSPEKAVRLAAEAEIELRGDHYLDFLAVLYGNRPAAWSDDLTGYDRWRVIVNALTRLRFCTPDGRMDFSSKGGLDDAPAGYLPWFDIGNRQSAQTTIVFGHWASLGLQLTANLMALDTGCVWGRSLTAVRLHDRQIYQVECEQR